MIGVIISLMQSASSPAGKPSGGSSPRFNRGASGRAVAPSIRYPQHQERSPSPSSPETVIDGLPGACVCVLCVRV